MFHPALRRTVTATCALAATGTMVLTAAVVAEAAPAPRVRSQAAAQAGVVILASSDPLNTGRVRVVYTGETRQVRTAPVQTSIPGQDLLRLGVTTAKAAAGNGRSYGCSGILAEGGTFQVGDDGTTCRAVYPGSGGVSLDLGSLTSGLPVGVGNISLLLNGITSNARFVDGAVSGVGRLDNARLSVCLGLTVDGACVGAPVVVPLRLRGGVNEDVVTTIVNTLTATPALAAVATTLSNALRAAVNLRTNVQVTDPTTGVIKVTGLKLILLQRAGAVTALGIAQAGPA